MAAASADITSTTPYAASIIFATASLLVTLLIIPPMCWHYRNRNIGATLLVGWTVAMNFLAFLNALIWSNDIIPSWYDGVGLCDVEVKAQMAWGVAAPAALASVLRALANAMDTNRATLVKSKAQKKRDLAIDLTLCIGFPALQMLFHYIVQSSRYYILGIIGCVASVSQTWLTTLLMHIPPIIWTVVDVYFAIVIMLRLCRYRLSFAAILDNSNMTKYRFLRLYIFCIVLIIAFVPIQTFVLYQNLIQDYQPFKWHNVHNPTTWNTVIMIPSNGHILYEGYLWLGAGIVIFIFFGLGKDAVAMYRSGLLAAGFGRVFPSLQPGHSGRSSVAGTISSFGSKARLLFSRGASIPSFHKASYTSQSTISEPEVPQSPKTVRRPQSTASAKAATETTAHEDLERAQPGRLTSSLIDRISMWFRTTKSTEADLPLAPMREGRSPSSRNSTGVRSTVKGRRNGVEIVVSKEVRQASETAETLPSTTFGQA
ncbi:hypothetical protein BAUCODRAFT_437239 [Baudoinia panamericana UAMH 10762]|uniref:Uncharacterized protein n=1 Tax=Baudoinia panamericana (strain UAMH 10762) TaxID=717646 RepID=M2NDU0_BAUPA|nr:uncharacterized protein BAUCODRAFT_437239 [Baudoinia panamericana UAMH 10762]EMC97070.1 hypothetical protein BAUCODRAFT_437239 [Baudoinia panamericana UAMH 10762]